MSCVHGIAFYLVMWHIHLVFMVLHFDMSHSDPAIAALKKREVVSTHTHKF